jgi:hypothetical protein
MKELWRWAYAEDLVKQPIIKAVSINIEKRKRDRIFTDAEIKATWAVRQTNWICRGRIH